MSLQRRYDGQVGQWSGYPSSNFTTYISPPQGPNYYVRPRSPSPQPTLPHIPQLPPLPPLPPVPKPFPLTDIPKTPMTPTEKRLDTVTRSRNKLIIVAIILSAGFLAVFTTILIMRFPPPSLQVLEVQVKSTRSDFTYKSELDSPDNYAYKIMETTMCSQVTNSATGAGTIQSCKVAQFEQAATGVSAYVRLVVELDGKSPTARVTAIGTAIITASSTDSDWTVNSSDIKVIAPGSGSAMVKSIQLPVLILLLYVLHSWI